MTDVLPRMRFVVAGAILAFGCAMASADEYPSRPVTVIVPYPPGAATDLVARTLQEPMTFALGQPVIIENRPGAGGTVGTMTVSRSSPDGYTLLVTVNAPITMNKYFQKNYSIDPKTAFAPISNLASAETILAVNSAVPVKTVADLIAYAKANEGKISFGSSGVGSAHQIAGELLNQKAGIKLNHVPYRGGGPAIQDLLANHIPVLFGSSAGILPHAKSGAIRIVALAEAKRSPDLPDVPTIAETVPGVVTATWVGMFAPARTPPQIVKKLNKIVVEALKRPEIIAKLKLGGANTIGSTPEELKDLAATEFDQWGKIIPSLGIQPE